MFDILYNHADFVAINKHPGVSVHKDDGDTMLIHEVEEYLGESKLYLVHRLDKMTSGILLLAKSSEAASKLAKLFADRNISKFYLAIGAKKPKKKQGLVMGDMERSRRSSWKLLNSMNNPAITQFFSMAGENGQRLFLCKPHTGKTHQIRVALNSVGSAIIGDPIYNSGQNEDRGYLHAYATLFEYEGEVVSLVCPPRLQAEVGKHWLSSSMTKALEEWNEPWSLNWPKIKMNNSIKSA
ncbi:TIGR01621 family pseudouridine synthase [Vibrio maerlii]|uniref:TIGR01621 family pseudouridine synthase n=1 Tax=Vibrio maerlii TaxID=2231648 RepID=UPI000E3B91EB|nr:TIGR01621 family pseudouridine synthase [Vibrio maerlii]